jgi:Ca2+-binding RTX toxin-like protein
MPMFQSSTVTVNSTTAGTQSNPAVVALEDGRQIMVWVSGTEVRGAFASPAGVAGADFLISDNTVSAGSLSVTADAGGGFSVVWTSANDSYVRSFNTAGTAPLGSATYAATAAGEESNAVSAFLEDGQRLTAWFDDDGVAPVVKFKIGTAAEATASGTLVTSDKVISSTVLADGGFVVAWKSGTDVLARKFDMNGVAAGAEFSLTSASTVGATGGQVNIVALATGGFLATWTTASATVTDIEARLFNADLTPASAVLSANELTTNAQSAAHAVQLDDGRIMMVWQSGNGTDTDVHARLMGADGTFLSGDWVVASGAGNQGTPKVALMSDGRVSVTFDNAGDIASTVIDPSIFYGVGTADLYTGGNAADSVFGLDGDDTISGGDGSDRMYGGNGNDLVGGGIGNDFVYGNEGDDTLNGDTGDDYLAGNNGNDILNGGEGNDALVGGAGNDTYSGGTGVDTLSYVTATSAVIVSLASSGTFSGGAAGDSLSSSSHSIENLLGTNRFNDQLTGSTSSNKLVGYAGNDILDGGAGSTSDADTLDGGAGNDTLNGNRGNDTLIGGDGNDTMNGGDSSDTFRPGTGEDDIDGGAATSTGGSSDLIDYYRETVGQTVRLNDSAFRAAGGDRIVTNTIENVYGSDVGNDNITANDSKNSLRGYGGNDTISALGGDDTVLGGFGNDTLTGGLGNDTINGDDGNDLINGGAGKDKLSGGTGFDDFRYSSVSELDPSLVDTMTSFVASEDTFQFVRAGFSGLASLNAGIISSTKMAYNTTGVADDSDCRFIFETDTRILWYDADGTGVAAAIKVIDISSVSGTVNSATGTAFSNLDIELI